MPRGGLRPGGGRPSDPWLLIRAAGHMMASYAALLHGLAANSHTLGEGTLLEETARAIRRDAMAASRRLDRAARVLRDRAKSHPKTTTTSTAPDDRAEVSSDPEEVPLRHTCGGTKFWQDHLGKFQLRKLPPARGPEPRGRLVRTLGEPSS